jgi:hypothetical protein
MKINPALNTQKNGGGIKEMQLKRTKIYIQHIIFISFILKEMWWAEALDICRGTQLEYQHCALPN